MLERSGPDDPARLLRVAQSSSKAVESRFDILVGTRVTVSAEGDDTPPEIREAQAADRIHRSVSRRLVGPGGLGRHDLERLKRCSSPERLSGDREVHRARRRTVQSSEAPLDNWFQAIDNGLRHARLDGGKGWDRHRYLIYGDRRSFGT